MAGRPADHLRAARDLVSSSALFLAQDIPGVCITTVCNRTPASSHAAAQALGIPGVAADWRSLVADPAVDAVVIGTWPYTHAAMACEALAAGKHVLCEARMVSRAVLA